MSKEQEIKDLVEKHPRHFSQMVKRSPDLMSVIDDIDGKSVAEKIYQLIHPDVKTQCEYGKKKKFHSMSDGYRYCGRASSCQCARESVSQSVSATKSLYTEEKKSEIQKKTKNTLASKYGVTNVGQLPIAKENHRRFYENKNQVKKVNEQVANTKKAKYGDKNYNNRSKSQKTCLDKYGVLNPMQNSQIAKKSAKKRKSLYDPTKVLPNNYHRIIQNIKNDFNLEVLTPIEEYTGVASRPEWEFRCIDCGHQFVKRFDYSSLPRCLVCHPSPTFYKSKQELEILEFVKSKYFGNVISGDRSIIPPFEVDIFVPEKKFAIEYCGLYWHSECSSGKGRLYHQKKMIMLQEQGIELLTIFSDEYESRKDIVERIISNRLGDIGGTPYNARQCDAVSIPKDDAKIFHNDNHIQGYCKNSSIHIGLKSNDKLVMVMSFRLIESGCWELVRMSSLGRVRGGATKLFKYFVDNQNPSIVKTFADLRWSNGGVYEKMGFQLDGTVPPMQTYVIDYSRRVSKRSFSKSRLVENGHNPNMSEWEIIQDMGIDRIWDCGKKRFVWKNTQNST